MVTIFDKIIDGEIPSYKVYEDENTVAFLDVNPAVKGHTLVIHKRERVASLGDMSDEAGCQLMNTVQAVNRLLKKKLSCDGVNHLLADGSVSGQSVFHVHMHIIPRYKNDGLNLHESYEALDVSENEFKEVLHKLQR